MFYGNDMSNPKILFARGNLHYRLKEFPLAVPLLSEYCRAVPDDHKAKIRLASCHDQLGNIEAAREIYAKLVSQLPDDSHTLDKLGSALEKLGEEKEALIVYERSYRCAPNAQTGDRIIGLHKKLSPEWMILDTMSRAVPDHAGDGKWLYDFAVRLESAGRTASAAEHFVLAADANPRSSWWSYRAARALEAVGEVRASDARYAIAVALDRKYDCARWGRGALHEAARRWDLAAMAFKNDIPSAQEVWRRAGLAYRSAYCSANAMAQIGRAHV